MQCDLDRIIPNAMFFEGCLVAILVLRIGVFSVPFLPRLQMQRGLSVVSSEATLYLASSKSGVLRLSPRDNERSLC
jgi:hypothetical protein